MIRFNNDYNRGAHENILKRLTDINEVAYEGYGLDEICSEARLRIRKRLNNMESKVHFLVAGTQTNVVVLRRCISPVGGVISPDSGHINVHETGALERAGFKILTVPHINGKISAGDIERVSESYEKSVIKEHIVRPEAVYISFPTEFGTIYSRNELEEIYNVCKKHGLVLFIDGARLAYGLGSCENDIEFSDLGSLCDVFYIGGTKCGALFGEAVVINNTYLDKDFRAYIKQSGAMLAKGWLLGVQFDELFKDDLYFEIGKRACRQADRIKEAFLGKGFKMYIPSSTNQIFVIIDNKTLSKLDNKYYYEYEFKVDDDYTCVRFCTAFSTKDEEVDELVKDINNL